MDRRHFLHVAAMGTVMGFLLDEQERASGDARPERLGELTTPSLLAMLDAARVREIGTRYREAHPTERSAGQLRAAILDAYPPPAHHWASHVPVAELVRADFATGRVVVVNGWVLSLTEARQCALYSLLSA